jgi:TolA-binding protein
MEQAMAMSLLLQGRLADAEAGFHRAGKEADNDVERALANTGLGGVELQRHNYSGADKLLEEALQQEPKRPSRRRVYCRLRRRWRLWPAPTVPGPRPTMPR